jgi:SNF2 family DNA or RNA helicase
LGGILADSMGLGKSLSSLALITSTIGQANSFAQAGYGSIDFPKRLAKTTLLITPTSSTYLGTAV